MPWNVSGFCPQTLAFAPNVEHWDTRSVEKPLPIWLLPSTACKLEGGKRGSRELSSRTCLIRSSKVSISHGFSRKIRSARARTSLGKCGTHENDWCLSHPLALSEPVQALQAIHVGPQTHQRHGAPGRGRTRTRRRGLL